MNTAAFVRTFLFLGFVAITASGCGFSRAIGGAKSPPDEFAITKKAPLVVPPDYSLRPPRPGETRPEELSPADRARQVLVGDAAAAPPSPGEQILLRKANALTADANIRNMLNAENGGRGEKERSFANQIIFWRTVDGEIDDSAAPLRVDDPEAWMAARRRAIEAAIGEDGKVVINKDSSLNLPGVF